MKSKIIKSTDSKKETIVSLQQKIKKLQIQIDGFKNKILKLENKSLKQEQTIFKLRSENTLIKTQIPGTDEYQENKLDPDLKEMIDKITNKSTK